MYVCIIINLFTVSIKLSCTTLIYVYTWEYTMCTLWLYTVDGSTCTGLGLHYTYICVYMGIYYVHTMAIYCRRVYVYGVRVRGLGLGGGLGP